MKAVVTRFLILAVSVLGWTQVARSQTGSNYLVLGVIVQNGAGKSVALIKNTSNNSTLAVREGQLIRGGNTVLVAVKRKEVTLKIDGRNVAVAVGETTQDASSRTYRPETIATAADGVGYTGVERQGNTTKVSSALRDHIVTTDLSKVMMQAAAVPRYVNGRLHGFSLHDIEPGSVYEQIGLREGDLVTHINGQSLSDVANTIKLLRSLKDEPNASMTLQRGGVEQNLNLVIQ